MRLRLGCSWILPCAFLLATAGGCEEPLADGTRACQIGQVGCPDGYVCRRSRCPDGLYACFRRTEADRESYALPVCIVNGRCEELACENPISCPEDCGAHCDISAMTSVSASDSLVAEISAPLTGEEAKDFGVDLDGDGERDNKLGAIIGLFQEQGILDDANGTIAQQIQSGNLVVVLKLWTEEPSASSERSGVMQLLGAEPADATPLFDGQDRVRISSEASQDVYLCGLLQNGRFVSERSPSPVRLPLPLAVPGGGSFVGTIDDVRVEGSLDASGWVTLEVGGGISEQTLNQEFLPWFAEQMNIRIRHDPENLVALTLLDLFDDNCEWTIRDCGPPPAGCVEDGEISADEARCNALLHSALSPDVDIDGDGVRDLLSVGYRIVSAVPVTVVE